MWFLLGVKKEEIVGYIECDRIKFNVSEHESGVFFLSL